MNNLREALALKSSEYIDSIPELKGQVPSPMVIDFVIEQFRARRNYQSYHTDEFVDKDMSRHVNTMAMAVVDVYGKIGNEGETSHSENDIQRVYENPYISETLFANVLPFVGTF